MVWLLMTLKAALRLKVAILCQILHRLLLSFKERLAIA